MCNLLSDLLESRSNTSAGNLTTMIRLPSLLLRSEEPLKLKHNLHPAPIEYDDTHE